MTIDSHRAMIIQNTESVRYFDSMKNKENKTMLNIFNENHMQIKIY